VDVGFDIYRQIDGAEPEKINSKSLIKTTDFVDTTAPQGKVVSYRVRAISEENEGALSAPATIHVGVDSNAYTRVKLQGNYAFQKVGVADLDGDGRYDYVIKQPGGNVDPYINYWKRSPETFKLEAYTADGDFLWRHDLGWAIERGIWYSPYVVYDFDGDGKAEVAVKTGEGDPRDKDGRVQSGAEYLTILDGLTGEPITRIEWPSRSLFDNTTNPYNYASRNQLGVAFLDGKTPCLIVERGTYNVIVVIAYELSGGKLRELWQWDNLKLPRHYSGQGAHFMHAADVDGDGRDEVTIGSVAIDDNGESLWSTGLGHPDHHYVGDLDPSRPGLEIYYGIESPQRERNGMCLVDAATGEIIWGHEGSTRHVHSRGMCSDIDARYEGAECYSADTDEQKKADRAFLRTASGQEISNELRWSFGPLTVYWDADPQREIIWRRRISDYEGMTHEPQIEGGVIVVADIQGDWREEIITSVDGEIRLYTTTIPAVDRRPCLMTDPIYRIDVAHGSMGYTQVPMLTYDLASRAAKIVPVAPSDFNGDGRVDFVDYLNFTKHFGQDSSDEGFDAQFDLNKNGDVGFSDFVLFAQHFGQSVG
ncbi:MAG: dockerin type I domain-containing protein, partial [Candidatus Latescibacteria bacterium]|nr:dockerin type I domain-containing protein [Candidatus Latescibacterota bacterium]